MAWHSKTSLIDLIGAVASAYKGRYRGQQPDQQSDTENTATKWVSIN